MSDIDIDPGADLDTGDVSPDPGTPDTAPAYDPIVDPFESGQQVFQRPYVEKLREQAVTYRTQLRETQSAKERYDQAFGGFEEAQANAALDFVRMLREDPATAAEAMRDYIRAVEEANAPPPPIEPGSPNDPNRPMTYAEFERIQAEQAQAAQEYQFNQTVAMHQARLAQAAAENGLNPKAAWSQETWQEAADHMTALMLAQHLTGGDVGKAVEIMRGRSQQSVDQFVRSRVADARQVPPPAQGAVPGGRNPADVVNQREDWKDANKIAYEMLSHAAALEG